MNTTHLKKYMYVFVNIDIVSKMCVYVKSKWVAVNTNQYKENPEEESKSLPGNEKDI